jgi:hypothetical protein
MSHPQRRKKFIDASVQGALARRLVLQWFAFVMIAGICAYALQVLSNPFRSPHDHFRDLWVTHAPLFVSVFFLLPVFVIDTIRLSHRFAGPVLRLRRAMREVINGQQPRTLKFRDDDYWQELADDFNSLMLKCEFSLQHDTHRQDEERSVAAAR